MEKRTARTEPQRKTRRTANACVACRSSKIKCSGDCPCQNCEKRSVRCHFSDGGTRVTVSERYLQDLRKQARQQQQQQQQQQQRQCATASSHHSESPGQHHASVAQGASQNHDASPTSPILARERRPSNSFGPFSNPMSESLGQSSRITSINHATSTDSRTGAAIGLVSPESNVDLTTQQPEGTLNMAVSPDLSYVGSGYEHGVLSTVFSVPSMVVQIPKPSYKRGWVWLAPWSTWSFTLRLMTLLREKLQPESPAIPPELVSPNVYSWTWKTSANSDPPDISGLPSVAHAVYLFNAVKFHLDQTYRLFDDEFENQIHQFYSKPHQMAGENRLWFVKFLLILAFGTAFQTPSSSNVLEPPGAKFYKRAMTLIPDSSSLYRDSMIAIEVLALSAIYLYAADEREAAYMQLGQALRIAQLDGMHTQLPEPDVGVETLASCRDLWWTLYIMDRHFSQSLGLPMSVQDSDITTPVNPPNLGSQIESARSLQVNLSHLMSIILKTLYRPEVIPLGAFLEQTKSILHTLAYHASDIERIVGLKFQMSVGSTHRRIRHVILLYHQCVVVATRPLLLSILKERLDMLGRPEDEHWGDFLAQTGSVISTSIKSAVKMLEILTSEYSLLEAFLPYDIEFAFAAALHLTMANALFPNVINYDDYRLLSRQILDNLVARGNRIAAARRAELVHLEQLFQTLTAQIQRQGHPTLNLQNQDTHMLTTITMERSTRDMDSSINREEEDASMAPIAPINGAEELDFGMALEADHLLGNEMSNCTDFLNDIGISSEEFNNIVQQIGDPGTLPESMLTLG